MPTPWNANTRLMHVGIKGYDVDADGEAAGQSRLPDRCVRLDGRARQAAAAEAAFRLLVDKLGAGRHGVDRHLCRQCRHGAEPTKASDKAKILSAIDNLSPGGSTAGEEGIREAYQLAEQTFVKDGVNRVMLATDGDFNVGLTDDDDLKRLIEEKRKTGVFLSVLGFGRGNYNDELMQTLAQNGNGTAAYIDTLAEARRCWSRSRLDAVYDRQGREDPGRVQSGQGRRVPADRLRDPRAEPRGLQQRQGRCRRHRLGPHGDGDLRDHAEGRAEMLDDLRYGAGHDRQWRRRRTPANMRS